MAPERVEHHATSRFAADAGQGGQVLLDLVVLERAKAREVELPLTLLNRFQDGLDLARLGGRKAGVGEELLEFVRRSISHDSPVWHGLAYRCVGSSILDLLRHPRKHEEDQVIEGIRRVVVARAAVGLAEDRLDPAQPSLIRLDRSILACFHRLPSVPRRIIMRAQDRPHPGGGEVKPTVISLFSGVGGLDLGFEAAGFRTAVALEIDRTCCQTIRLNRDWSVIESDVHSVSSKDLLKAAGLRPGQADILIGGPPCQPFSKSGYWATGDSRRLDDPRADTLTAYLRVLKDARPQAFLLENVRGLAYSGKDEGLRHLLSGISQVNREARTNYRVEWKTLNAADFGVPQLRERVFLIGSRDGAPFRFPEPTHSADAGEELFPLEPHRTTWDALGDLPEDDDDPALIVGGKWGDLLPSIPEGENYLFHTNRGGGRQLFGWRRRFWSFLLKIAKARPSWTIQAQPGPATGPFHWRSRRLSARELCRLQSMPDGIKFDCARSEVQRMLGNAVPSLLAEVLARKIKTQLLGIRSYRQQLKLLPPTRGPAPPPERVRAVPRKYLSMIGDHSDHPGTGMGFGRERRSQRAELGS